MVRYKVNTHWSETMGAEIILEAQKLIQKIKGQYPAFVGRTATDQEILDLEYALRIKLLAWYRDLYLKVPIIDAEFGFQEYPEEDGYDGVSYMMWGALDTVLQESTAYVPGKDVREKGLLLLQVALMGAGIRFLLTLIQVILQCFAYIMMILV
jgi:hypothetical protein